MHYFLNTKNDCYSLNTKNDFHSLLQMNLIQLFNIRTDNHYIGVLTNVEYEDDFGDIYFNERCLFEIVRIWDNGGDYSGELIFRIWDTEDASGYMDEYVVPFEAIPFDVYYWDQDGNCYGSSYDYDYSDVVGSFTFNRYILGEHA